MAFEHIEWRPIPELEDRFVISNTGIIKSIARDVPSPINGSRPVPSKVITQFANKLGYKRVCLRAGKLHNYFVHRLVALTFIPNPNNYPIINHKDSNPSNNNVDNLEWCDQSYNVKHAYKTGRATPSHTKKILQYTPEFDFIKSYSSIAEASRILGIWPSSISLVANGLQCLAGGYIFKFENT